MLNIQTNEKQIKKKKKRNTKWINEIPHKITKQEST